MEGNENSRDVQLDETPGLSLAVTAEVLYLSNLLILPGVAFMLLLWLYIKHGEHKAPLARCHIRQTVSATIWAGVMLVLVNVLIVLLGGYTAAYTWVIVILYFTTVHASLVLLGTLGLARAMAGKHYHYPLIGVTCSGSASAPGSGSDLAAEQNEGSGLSL